MRIGGLRLFLLASCLAAAAASWFTTEGLALRAALASLALIAAVPLVALLRGADREAPAAPESRETDTIRTKRARRQPRQRGPERLETLETQLVAINEELAEHQHTLYELAKTLRKLNADNTERAERLEQRLTDHEHRNHQQRAALQETHRHHLQRLQHTIGNHKEGLAALERTLAAATAAHTHSRAIPVAPSHSAPGRPPDQPPRTAE